MASRKPGRITIGSRAVAVAIMAEALDQACRNAGVGAAESEVYAFSGPIAEELVRLAWDVEYKPNSERLVLILDAGITSEDKMRSTPEDHDTAGVVPPQ